MSNKEKEKKKNQNPNILKCILHKRTIIFPLSFSVLVYALNI